MSKVSVIIAIYNPPKKHIHESLNSVFRQTFADFEVIVVDDGSSVNTKEMLEPYRNRIRYFYKKNGGANTARLFGLKKAQGEYIALIDQDDLWEPDKLQKQVEFLDAYPELDLIFSDFYNFNEQGPYPTSFLDSNEIFRKIPTEIASNLSSNARKFPQSVLYEYMRRDFILQSTLMARKIICEKYEMFITKTNGREFWEFSLRSLHLLKIGFIDEILAHRRRHGNNVIDNFELFQINTAIISEQALNYPWMDSKCRLFLKNTLEQAYLNLGSYYVAKGNFIKARSSLKRIFSLNKFCTNAIIFYCLTFTKSPKIISAAKAMRRVFV